ncbi:MAG: DUF4920 domain-containing protein [Saprospiraceae bacterium]|nr:DUF4920 domain-containing protein [Saprospiraceae bacterium]
MKSKTLLIVFLAATGLLLNTTSTAQESIKVNFENFGNDLSPDGAISYEQFLLKMADSDSMSVKIEATVSEVCQMKGCWMALSSVEPTNNTQVMVRFKDYAFFVPKDISGRTVIIEGMAYRETTPVDELRHYAEDAGKSQEEIDAITEPKEELKFMANGVLLKK